MFLRTFPCGPGPLIRRRVELPPVRLSRTQNGGRLLCAEKNSFRRIFWDFAELDWASEIPGAGIQTTPNIFARLLFCASRTGANVASLADRSLKKMSVTLLNFTNRKWRGFDLSIFPGKGRSVQKSGRSMEMIHYIQQVALLSKLIIL